MMRAGGWRPPVRARLAAFGVVLVVVWILSSCGRTTERTVLRAEAEAVLTQFLDHLHAGRYEEASRLYGGEYGFLVGWNPGVSAGDRVQLLENGCAFNGLSCHPLHRVVSVETKEPGVITLLVELQVTADSVLTIGPCCGEVAAPESRFRFTVRRVGDRLLVMDLPPTQP
jgi:hypothetical protein